MISVYSVLVCSRGIRYFVYMLTYAASMEDYTYFLSWIL
jgi:hypothetical protein